MACPRCGYSTAEGDVFCGRCGASLQAEREQPSRSSLGSPERCRVCGATIRPHQISCPSCRAPRGHVVDPSAERPVRFVRPGDSTGGVAWSPDDVPAEIRGGWNWGGCTMGCLWAFAMNMPVWGIIAAASSLIGCLSLPVAIILGVKGNEWAWRSRRFSSIEEFRQVQRKWAIAGITLTVLALLLYAAAMVALLALNNGL